MSRCWNYIGLSLEAKKFLEENSISKQQYIDYDPGWYGETYPFYSYQLKDGSVLREVVQCEPWWGGPNTFTCLESLSGKRYFEWSKEELY